MAWTKLAFYDEVLTDADGDFNAFAEKASPINADIVLIEDSAASYGKKKVQVGNLPGGGGSSTWVGLTDTAGSITANKLVKGNAGGTALDFSSVNEADYMLKTGARAMSSDLDMGGHNIVEVAKMTGVANDDYLILFGGQNAATSAAAIYLFGKDHTLYPGRLQMMVPDNAETGVISVLESTGCTDSPVLTVPKGLTLGADLNFNKKNADAMCIEPLASAPGTPAMAQMYYNTGDDHLYVYAS